MPRIPRIVLAAVPVLLAAGCAPGVPAAAAAGERPPPGAEEHMRAFVEVWNRDDADALRAMLAPDVAMIGDGSVREGPAAVVEEWARGNMAASAGLAVTPVATGSEDGTAYHAGRWTLRVSPPGAEPFTSTGSHTFVWRQAGGTWQLRLIHIDDDPRPQR